MTTLSAKIAGVIAAVAGAIGTFAQNPSAICSVPALLERRGTAA